MYRLCGKRLFDLLLAVSVFFLLAPLMVLIGILIRMFQGQPVFFRQFRPGLNARPFEIYKFCTMNNLCDETGRLLPDAERLTRIGRFLRFASLDELPELMNVIKGDMSIVGPRPLLIQYLNRYTPEQARRHEVKPGLTGWAQVNGRNALTWEQKFAYDVWYVDHQSLRLDLKIIALTLWKIFKREGISAEGEATMPEFNPQISQNNAD